MRSIEVYQNLTNGTIFVSFSTRKLNNGTVLHFGAKDTKTATFVKCEHSLKGFSLINTFNVLDKLIPRIAAKYINTVIKHEGLSFADMFRDEVINDYIN